MQLDKTSMELEAKCAFFCCVAIIKQVLNGMIPLALSGHLALALHWSLTIETALN